MRHLKFAIVMIAACIAARPPLSASGPVGLYGIVERVVFEPSQTAPERVQVWGAFAYVGSGTAQAASSRAASSAERGYLYFKLPMLIAGFRTQADVDAAKREWADLHAVAGTGQAVAFGLWGYIGSFASLNPATNGNRPPYILESRPTGGSPTDLRIRPASEAPANPATYQTNAGVVKLSDQGNHAVIVAQLKERLRQ